MNARTPFRRPPFRCPHAALPAAVLVALAALALSGLFPSPAAAAELGEEIERRIDAVMDKVITWRRDIHQHPELSNREERTAGVIADHLRSLGLEVETGVAHTGVVALIEGGRPGPVVALRADMDALPVTEQVDLPFASRETAIFNGAEVGVMHACGHDNHVAILMGVAEVLTGVRDRLPGSVKLIFQPAEEGAPAGEEGGADLMIREGVLEAPVPEAIFGLHATSALAVGEVAYRSGSALASADGLRITLRGKQTHAAMPWNGVDPIVVAAQVVLGLQTIASRQIDVTRVPAVVSIGSIHGGVRGNIIPDRVELWGTIRAFDPAMREDIHRRVRRTAESIAAASGAAADVEIEPGYPVTYNDPGLTRRMAPTLERIVGAEGLIVSPLVTGAEDFSYFQKKVPGLFYFLGVRPPGTPLAEAAPNHSPYFFADEAALPVGVRTLTALAVDFLTGSGGPSPAGAP